MRRRVAWNILRNAWQGSRFKIMTVSIMGCLIWFALFLFPYMGFEWVALTLGERGTSNTLLALFFFLLMVMLIFSNTVISYSTLFCSDEAQFLNSAPVRPGSLFLYKMGESLAFSSWAFFLLGVPILIAFGVHKRAPQHYYIALIFFFISFVLIPATIGAMLSLVISIVLRPWIKWLTIRIAVAAILAALIIGPAWFLTSTESQPSTYVAGIIFQKIEFSTSVYLPSAWMTRGLASLSAKATPEGMWNSLYYFGLLLSNSLFLCLVAYAAAERFYNSGWNRIQSTLRKPRFIKLFPRLGRTTSSPVFNFIVKDLKTFLRDPAQWMQCTVLFGLLGLYILNLRNMRYEKITQLRMMITFLNLGAISLVLATLTTRFVFPLLSLEGHRFWIVGLMPISRNKLLFSKLAYSVAGSMLVTCTLMILSDLILKESVEMIFMHVLVIGMISVGLSGLAVGLGAVYPNLRESSPAKIVSGFGGTLNLIISLMYVIIVVVIIWHPAYQLRFHKISEATFHTEMWIAVGQAILLSIAVFCLPMALGIKKLAEMET